MEQMIKDLFLNEDGLEAIYVVSMFNILRIPTVRIEHDANTLSKDAEDFLWSYLKMAYEYEIETRGQAGLEKYELYSSLVDILIEAGLQVDFDDMDEELQRRLNNGEL